MIKCNHRYLYIIKNTQQTHTPQRFFFGDFVTKKGVTDMASFIVNGQEVSPSKNQKLLRFLRDELHITSAKDGCSEGACGACTVIIDGQTCKSCVPTQIHWPERMSSQSRGFLIGNRKFTLMLTGRQALYSADSVFLVWLCAQKHFWM